MKTEVHVHHEEMGQAMAHNDSWVHKESDEQLSGKY